MTELGQQERKQSQQSGTDSCSGDTEVTQKGLVFHTGNSHRQIAHHVAGQVLEIGIVVQATKVNRQSLQGLYVLSGCSTSTEDPL